MQLQLKRDSPKCQVSCRAQFFQPCVHATGDRANREVLNIFEETFLEHHSEQSGRWRCRQSALTGRNPNADQSLGRRTKRDFMKFGGASRNVARTMAPNRQ